MWRPFLIVGVLALAAGEVRAADILELLKTHKVVIGKGCREPCTPESMNPVSEIRLANSVVAEINLKTKTGLIYPVNKEEDILNHQLMAGYFQRFQKPFSLRTMARVEEDVLVLVSKQAYGVNPRDPINAIRVHRIRMSGRTCGARQDVSHKGPTLQSSWKFRFPCEVVPVTAASEPSAKPGWRSLLLADIKDPSIGRSTQSFSLLNERLYFDISGCRDGSSLAVEFDWNGGSRQGSHRCNGPDGLKELVFSSKVEVEGTRRHLTATGSWIVGGKVTSRTALVFDVIFVLDGRDCRIEKFYYKNTAVRSADAKSRCYLD